jgi:hypothetical protein
VSLLAKAVLLALVLSGSDGGARVDAGVPPDGGRPMPTWREHPVKWEKLFDGGFPYDRDTDEW